MDYSQFVDPDQAPEEAPASGQDFSTFVDPDAGSEPVQPGQSAQSPQPAQPGLGARTFNTAVDVASGVNSAIGPAVRGILQLGAELVGSQGVKRSLAEQDLEEKAMYERAAERSPLLSRLSNVATSTALYAGVPGGTTGGILRKIATGALSGAGIGAIQQVGEEDSRLRNAGVGAAFGAVGVAAGEAVRGAYRAARPNVGPRQVAASAEAGLVPGRNTLPDIGLTPSELNPINAQLKANTKAAYVISEKTKARLQEVIVKRDAASRQAFGDILNDIVPEGTENAKKAVADIFTRIDSTPVDTASLLQNPIISKAYAKIAGNSEYIEPGAVPGTLGGIRAINEVLDDRIKSLLKKEEINLARRIMKAKNEFLTKLDQAVPEYKAGRAIAQRLTIRDNFLKEYKSINQGKAGEILPEHIYDKFFSTTAKREYFLDEIAQTGVDPDAVNKVINTLHAIKGGDLRSIVSRAPRTGGLPSGVISIGQATAKRLQGLGPISGKHLIEMISDPKWSRQLGRIKSANNIESAAKLIFNTLGRVAASKNAQNGE